MQVARSSQMIMSILSPSPVANIGAILQAPAYARLGISKLKSRVGLKQSRREGQMNDVQALINGGDHHLIRKSKSAPPLPSIKNITHQQLPKIIAMLVSA